MNYKWEVVGEEGDDGGPVTEVVYLPIRSDIPPTHLHRTLQTTLHTISLQPGSLKTHYSPTGIQESPLTYELHTNWTSLSHHQKFITSPIYQDFYNDVCKILDLGDGKEVRMWHFKNEFAWGEGMGVMEVATFFCDGEEGDGKEGEGFGGKVRRYAERLEREGVVGCEGVGVGRVVERGVGPVGWLGDGEGGKGGKGKGKVYEEVFVLMISWVDVDAHMKFRESEVYKDMVGMLDGFEEFEMHHVQFREFGPGDGDGDGDKEETAAGPG